ncbi:hypothetical protein BDF14DRAFT_942083 [Spinellus fusiger]|nr:hypothetical protein BDF14DRAFT_942083 [Spinellus fusiger]
MASAPSHYGARPVPPPVVPHPQRAMNKTATMVSSSRPESGFPLNIPSAQRSKRKPRLENQLLEDDIPLALLAYKKGYAPIQRQILHKKLPFYPATERPIGQSSTLTNVHTHTKTPTHIPTHRSIPNLSHLSTSPPVSIQYQRPSLRPVSADVIRSYPSLNPRSRHSISPMITTKRPSVRFKDLVSYSLPERPLKPLMSSP